MPKVFERSTRIDENYETWRKKIENTDPYNQIYAKTWKLMFDFLPLTNS